MENFRRSIGPKIKEVKEVWEGEISELKTEEKDDLAPGSKIVTSVIIALKTSKGTKQLKLDPSLHENINREKCTLGDVIYIEVSTGNVKRVGRCLC